MKVLIEKINNFVKIKIENENEGTKLFYFHIDHLYFQGHNEYISLITTDKAPYEKKIFYFPFTNDVKYIPEPKKKLESIEDHLDYLAKYIFVPYCCNGKDEKDIKDEKEINKTNEELNNNNEPNINNQTSTIQNQPSTINELTINKKTNSRIKKQNNNEEKSNINNQKSNINESNINNQQSNINNQKSTINESNINEKELNNNI